MTDAMNGGLGGEQDTTGPSAGPQLSLVLPVYNESAAIQSVLDEWVKELDRVGLDFEILAYDDGSADDTLEILRGVAATEPRLRVVRHENRGHGPTIVRGYREARGEWVFQTDSDGELTPECFERMWRGRAGHDLVVGQRVGRRAPMPRRAVTAAARLLTRLLFGASIRDVNCPYRLMRRSSLVALLDELPESPFAPNVLLSGLAARRGLRIQEIPVPHRDRRGGQGSLDLSRLVRGALQAGRETLAVRIGRSGGP